MSLTSSDYKSYITSSEWRSKHKDFLAKSHYRCAFSGLKVGKGSQYNCHHMNYLRLGSEVLWEDVIVLHPWFHTWIIHGILSGFKRPSQQRHYPNKAQQVAHFWCTTPVMVRGALVILLLVNLIKVLWIRG